MDSSSRSIQGDDSQETQPPEISLEDPSTSSPAIQLVLNTNKWFGDRDVGRAISDTIRTYYKSPFMCLRDAPEDHKRFWWNCFKQRFTWDPEHEALVKKEWHEKVCVRVKHIVSKAGKAPPDKIITWMTGDIRASLSNKKETDETFKVRSERNKRNKMEGPKAEIGHSQRSISSTVWAERLAKQLGTRPSVTELFAATHSKVDATGQRIWCDAYAQSVYEKYEQLKADTDVQSASARDDHLFLKACGGWSEKGTIYGLGREGPALYERPTTSRRGGCSTSSAYTSPIVTQLQDQLWTPQSELQTTQARLQAMEEELRSTREELKCTRKQLEDQRMGLLELNARFDSFSALLGHPTRVSNSQGSS